MRRIDWRGLRGSFVLLGLALVVAAAATGGGFRYRDQASSGYELQHQRLVSERSRYGAIDAQRRLIETWLPAFRGLEAEGIIGDEQRLAWIEALRGVAARLALPALRYRIERRTAYEAGLEFETGAFRPFSTVVRIEAGLLHEGDLERLLRDLAARGAGLHRVERCDVSRAGPSFVMRRDVVNVIAQCDLRWITVTRIEARP